jgi:enoyl-CoA hydratase/carnithine racemase
MSLLSRIVIRVETIGKYDRVVLIGEKRNAFTPNLLEDLLGLGCERDLVITNEGPVFSAGLDLSIFLEGREKALEYLFKVHGLVKKLLECERRVVAHVRGDVYGFGVELLYFLDYVVAAHESVKFSLQGINLGLFPPYTVAIGSRLFSHGHLRIMLSRDFTAREALSFGVVSEIGGLELEKLFSPPSHVASFVLPKRRLLEMVDDAIPYLHKLAVVGTSEETRERLRKFFGRKV